MKSTFIFVELLHNLIRFLIKRKIIKLQPKNFKFKKVQKKRKIRYFKSKLIFAFGTMGLLLLRPTQLSSSKINKFKLFLKRAIRKYDRTNRFVWFNASPHLPLTRKPTNARMGKGKGKLKSWYTNIRGGVLLFEFINVRLGRSYYFIKQMKFRLGIAISAVTKFQDKISNFSHPRGQITMKTKWR